MTLGLKDCAFGVSVALIWGMGVVFAKAAITDFPPILLMSFRFTLSALVLLWLVKPPRGFLVRLFGVSIMAGGVQYSLTFTGLKGLDASVTALVLQLEVPLLVLLGVLTLKERPGARRLVGIAFAFAGVALMAGEPRVSGAWFSLLLVLGGALAWASCQAMIRSMRLDGITVAAWISLYTAPQLFLASLLFEDGQFDAVASARLEVWLVVIYLGLIMTALGDTLWNTLVRRHPISTIAPFLLMQPVFSALGAIVLLGEVLTIPIVLGGAIIASGMAFILFDPKR